MFAVAIVFKPGGLLYTMHMSLTVNTSLREMFMNRLKSGIAALDVADAVVPPKTDAALEIDQFDTFDDYVKTIDAISSTVHTVNKAVVNTTTATATEAEPVLTTATATEVEPVLTTTTTATEAEPVLTNATVTEAETATETVVNTAIEAEPVLTTTAPAIEAESVLTTTTTATEA